MPHLFSYLDFFFHILNLHSGRPGLCLLNGVISHLALLVGIHTIFRFHTDETVTMTVGSHVVGLMACWSWSFRRDSPISSLRKATTVTQKPMPGKSGYDSTRGVVRVLTFESITTNTGICYVGIFLN
jgi:hypothetical protein